MNKETQSIIRNIENILNGQPWYGRSINDILNEVDPSKVYTKPNGTEHSIIELLYHMITWAAFCLKHIEQAHMDEIKALEKMDWRNIDPEKHNWKDGIEQLNSIHQKINSILANKDDDFLKEMVREREFNTRFLLNGLVQHNIYHLGQIAYIHKVLK